MVCYAFYYFISLQRQAFFSLQMHECPRHDLLFYALQTGPQPLMLRYFLAVAYFVHVEFFVVIMEEIGDASIFPTT